MNKRILAGIFVVIPCLFCINALFADTIKPDIVDVQTTFKIGGVDKTNVVIGTGSNTASAYGWVSNLTGSITVNTGLGTVTSATANLKQMGTDTAIVTVDKSGPDIILKVYGVGTTTLSNTPVDVNWSAGGTP